MSNIKDFRKFVSNTQKVTLSFWMLQFEEGQVELNASYQRGYVWGHEQQQEFLQSLISGFPVGTVAVVTSDNIKDKYVEVVDGKQRLTTLQLFLENKIPVGEVYYKDFDAVDKRFFSNIFLPYEDLKNQTLKTRVEYFCKVNFSGVPQSENHKAKVYEMLKEME
ncbi:MAG: hypothetical protein [Caudoviricetes sp.]|nr:MAG: hypothetical protein [Caudoviricetes sp.]